jgi:hypothetical protein
VPWHSYTSLFGNSFKASLLPAQNDGSLKFLIFHKLIFRNGMNGDGTVKHNSAETVPQGRIYFISAGDKIKIGFSTRPLDRLKALQTAHPGCLAAPVLRPHLSTLEQMLKSWDGGGNRERLAGNIERTIRAIETLRQPAA